MSKWIVLVLGVSVALNGYLLKGIATGTGSARNVTPPQSVRFTTTPSVSSAPSQPKARDLVAVSAVPASASVDLAALKGAEEAKARAEKETAKEMGVVMGMPTPPAEKEGSPLVQQKPLPRKASVTGISSMLESVDQKLQLQVAQKQVKGESSDEEEKAVGRAAEGEGEPKETRSLEECIEIYENGPRPLSISMAMLNDEEVILLARAGKIQAYALEKVLGDLERAVLIRRALICASSFCLILIPWTVILISFCFVQHARLGPELLRTRISPCRTTTTLGSWVPAAKTSSVTFLSLSVSLVPSKSTASSTLSPWPLPKVLSSLPALVAARLSTLAEVLLLS